MRKLPVHPHYENHHCRKKKAWLLLCQGGYLLVKFKTINSQYPILPYLRQRSRSTKSKIVPHTTLPTTILPLQNLFSISNHFYPYHCSTNYNTTYNLLILIFQHLAQFTSYQYLFHINTYLCGFFFKNPTPRKLLYFKLVP